MPDGLGKPPDRSRGPRRPAQATLTISCRANLGPKCIFRIAVVWRPGGATHMLQSFRLPWLSLLAIPLLGAALNVQELPGDQLKTASAYAPAQKEDGRQARVLYGAALLNA